MNKVIKLFLLIALIITEQAAAEVLYRESIIDHDTGRTTLPFIFVEGVITEEDPKKYWVASEQAKKESFVPPIVRLNSNGGSVDAALRIGRMARKFEHSVQVYDNARCESACVLILAGAVSRTVWGQVFIHRPYLNIDQAMTQSAQKQLYEKIEMSIKEYLKESNVPTSLYDLMLRIPPEKSRMLSDAELQQYGLSEDDPYYDEAQNASLAKHFGLTKREYLTLENKCQQASNSSAYSACMEAGRR